GGIYGYNRYRKNRSKPEWRLDKPNMGSIREVVTATGSINPYVMVNVGTEISGKILKIMKDFNAPVKRGELLAMLDTEILQSNLETAQNELKRANTATEEAKYDLDLLQELVRKEMATAYDLKKAEFKHDQSVQSLNNAKTALHRAQKNLENAYIKSPIDGVIVSRNVDEGQTVAASLNAPTLFVIANNLEQMQITADVDEADIGKISVGLPVEFSVDAYSGRPFRGSVKQIRLSPKSEQNVVSYSVIIDAQNPDRRLLPGMTANVTIVVNAKQNVRRIPELAIRFRPSMEVWNLFGIKWDEDTYGLGAMRNLAQQMTPPDTTAAKSFPAPGSPERQPSRSQAPAGADTARATGMGRRGRPDRPPAGMSGNAPSPAAGPPMSSRRRGMAIVWVMENGVPKGRVIQTGISDGAYIEVLSGLEDTESLITGVIYKDPKQMTNPMMQSGPGMGRRF
ncbi:MAG: efflux RND transporter periplasmic adaptor subunit, partial [Candidatus Cloacimonetes bacterium]|nr:efflux RND transporter periplasmic adaptor subunit [Candidatus Cloacimonadota bacterium]